MPASKRTKCGKRILVFIRDPQFRPSDCKLETMRTLVTCFILSAAAWPQSPTPIVLSVLFPPQLKQYLAISDDQVARISNVSQQIYTLEATRIQRQAQLQLEISQETAKPVPDPTALGT